MQIHRARLGATGPEQAVALNHNLHTIRKLLADLLDAYRTLPRHFQAEVTGVIGALAQERAVDE